MNAPRVFGPWPSAVSEGRVRREIDCLYRRRVEGWLLREARGRNQAAEQDGSHRYLFSVKLTSTVVSTSTGLPFSKVGL